MSTETLRWLLAQVPVVVTGTGAIAAPGNSAAELWEAVVTARVPAVGRSFELGSRWLTLPVCLVRGLEALGDGLHGFHRRDRSAQMAWVALTEACKQAGLGDARGERSVGLMLGTSRGALAKLQEGFERLGDRRYPPSLSADCTVASISGVLAQGLGILGPTATVSATCASGAFAIAAAAEQIVLGNAEIMLAGGADAPLGASMVAQLDSAGVLARHEDPSQACRPFDVNRNGLVLGEGSGFLVLESAASAARRGAKVLARLAGWATGADDSGRAGVSATGQGVMRVAARALEVAGLAATDVSWVNPHGTGTVRNDAGEALGMASLFGEGLAAVPSTATKPVTGHCLGATPVLEAVICVEALQRGVIPPAANCVEQDPQCPLLIPRGTAQTAALRHAMSNSLGFWGYGASLVFSRP